MMANCWIHKKNENDKSENEWYKHNIKASRPFNNTYERKTSIYFLYIALSLQYIRISRINHFNKRIDFQVFHAFITQNDPIACRINDVSVLSSNVSPRKVHRSNIWICPSLSNAFNLCIFVIAHSIDNGSKF